MDSFADLPVPTSARRLIVARDGFEPPNIGVRVLCLTTWLTGNKKQDAFVFVLYQLSYDATCSAGRTRTYNHGFTRAIRELL